jgi:MSHA biogenesis protein MshO
MQGRGSSSSTSFKQKYHPGFTESRILNPASSSGFTLIEMIMVIVITGIIASVVAVFLKAPVDQYMDIARRAELTDIADMALYRLTADISTAVPNSLRVVCGANPCVEFLPASGVGRYRATTISATGAGDILDFAATAPVDSSFDIIGQNMTLAVGDYIVVGSTQSDGAPAYNTTATGVLRTYTGTAGSKSNIAFTATQFPAFAQLSSQRFDVVDGSQQAVTYACEGVGTSGGNGTGQLKRYWKYGFYTTQAAPPISAQAPIPPNVTAVQSAILADKISACAIDYGVANQRLGLLGVRLTLTSNNESISLYKEIHVNNAP